MQASQQMSRPRLSLKPVCGMILLRTDVVAAELERLVGRDGAEAAAADLEAVVEDDVRLQRAHHAHKLRAAPLFAGHVVVGEVEPHQVELAVIRAQLAHLPVHVRKVVVKVVRPVPVRLVVAHRVVAVAERRVVRVVPVEQRVIQADADALGAERIEEFPHDVAPERRIRRFPVRQLRVEQAEAVVVLRRQHGVLHAGLLREARPCAGVEIRRVEFVEERRVLRFGDLLHRAHPLAAGRNRIQPPVDEHAEPVVPEPLHPLVVFCTVKLVHFDRSFRLCIAAAGARPRRCPQRVRTVCFE